jgi:hypothetical protein
MARNAICTVQIYILPDKFYLEKNNYEEIRWPIGQKHLSLKAVKIIKIVIFLMRTFPVSWKKLDFFSSGFSLACIEKKKNMKNTKPHLGEKIRDGYSQKRTLPY